MTETLLTARKVHGRKTSTSQNFLVDDLLLPCKPKVSFFEISNCSNFYFMFAQVLAKDEKIAAHDKCYAYVLYSAHASFNFKNSL